MSTKKFVDSNPPATREARSERERGGRSAFARTLRNGFERGLLTLPRPAKALRIPLDGAEAAINGSLA